MVGSIRLLFLITFAVTLASAAYEVFKSCLLLDGSIGKCIYQDECDYSFKKIANRFRVNPPPSSHCEGNEKICCRDYPTHTAKQACRKYINMLEKAPDEVKPQIANGEKVIERGEFPHMVALGEVSTNTIEFKCGGTLITNKFVLTAAHCAKETIINYHARLGTNNIDDNFNKDSDIPIDRIINHPNYHAVQRINDISLFRLKRAVVLEPHIIFPACLNTEFEHEETKMIIAGWGKTGPDEDPSTSLMKATVTRSSSEYCKERLRFNITESQICAQDTENDADSCPGDSGGPLKISIGNRKYRLYKVIGVTSFGKAACASGDPGVYTRVSFYLDWIVKNVWKD